jgi:MoaA/NifB/PqqE/SkfB family radical SAM enzyme
MNESVKDMPPIQRLNLVTTKYCNLNCRMCDWKKSFPLFMPEPSFDQWKSVIQEFAMLGGKELEISGGEPMMRKDIYQIISHAKSCGLTVLMVSNGVLIGPVEVEKLLVAGLGAISISLEGPEELNDKLRGPGNFQKALNTIRNFLSHQTGYPDLRVYVGITLSKYNYAEILSFSKYLLEEIGVHSIAINPFTIGMLRGRNRRTRPVEFDIPPELIPDLTLELERLIEYAKSVPGELPSPNFLNQIPNYFRGKRFIPPGGCHIPETFGGIHPTGFFFSCWRYPPIGNVFKMSLTEILSSRKYQEFRKRALAGKCDGCVTSCYTEIYS